MKPLERVANLFIFFLIANALILYECYLNNIPFSVIFEPGVILGPVMLTVALGALGELLIYSKTLIVSQKALDKRHDPEQDQDEWSY